MITITANRYHDVCFGHRVYGHENKCSHLHGHNYRFTFFVESVGDLDSVGRVLDFSVIKTLLCDWLEDNWDHKMMLWEEDPVLPVLMNLDKEGTVAVPFNPTAENIGKHFLTHIAPALLVGTGTILKSIEVEETRKCSVTCSM